MKNLKFNSDILGAGEEGRDMRCKGRLCKWSLQTYPRRCCCRCHPLPSPPHCCYPPPTPPPTPPSPPPTTDMRCRGRLCKWSLQTYLTLLTNKQVGHISFINIARGTTNPEIDSVTWIKFSNNMAPLALVPNLATRWRHLQ